MKLYNNGTPNNRAIASGERLFYTQQKGNDGYDVIVDGTHDKKVLIQKHSNPLKDQQKDLKLIYLESQSEGIHWGSLISGYRNGEQYMIITEPTTNGITSTCKIRRLENEVKFMVNSEQCTVPGILANGILYSEREYLNDASVFEQDDKKALVLQYNDVTSKLELFDEMIVDGNQYKIVQIDDCTMKKYGEQFGVLQLVLIDTQFGSVKRNNEENNLKCVLRYARVKDKIMNSKAREIMTHHNKIKTGDYITHVFDRDESGVDEKRVYIVRSMIDMYNNCDSAICYNCDTTIKLLSNEGVIVDIPIYVEDNRARIDKVNESQNMSVLSSSYIFVVQENDITKRLMKCVQRIIVKDEAYILTGKDNIGMNGVIMFGMEIDKIDVNDDANGVANYHSQMDKIKPTNQGEDIVGEDEIIYGDSNIYTTTSSCAFTLTGSATLNTLSNTSCEVKVKSDTSLIGKRLVLTADFGNGNKVDKEILIVGW